MRSNLMGDSKIGGDVKENQMNDGAEQKLTAPLVSQWSSFMESDKSEKSKESYEKGMY